MFGKVRASSSSLDSLERPPSKILKHDSLSIYEATLMKLKLGSQRNLSSSPNEAVEMESEGSTASVSRNSMESTMMEPSCTSTHVEKSSLHLQTLSDKEAMTIDTDCSSESVQLSFRDCQSTEDSKQHQSRNVSVLYLFSKYNNSRRVLNSSYGEEIMIAEGDVSASTSINSINFQSLGSLKEQSEHECFSSSSLHWKG